MARFYADENFSGRVVAVLRTMGHDVLRTRENGQADLGIPDEVVLAVATALQRGLHIAPSLRPCRMKLC